jgi:hypothetical protein
MLALSALVAAGCSQQSAGAGSTSDAVSQGMQPPQNVVVTNSMAQPIPTAPTGTTNVAGTVGLASGASVSLASGGNTVMVGNSDPISVSGSVSLAGTPSVAVSALPDISGSVSITSGSVSVSGGSVGITGTPNVKVTDLPAISGSVSITGTPSVSQSGTWSAGVSNLKASPLWVQEASPMAVKPTDSRTAAFDSQLISIAESHTGGTGFVGGSNLFYAVPTGQRLVITHIGLRTLGQHDHKFSAELIKFFSGGSGITIGYPIFFFQHTDPSQQLVPFVADVYVASEQTEFIFDAGQKPYVSITRDTDSGTDYVSVAAAGYFLPAP